MNIQERKLKELREKRRGIHAVAPAKRQSKPKKPNQQIVDFGASHALKPDKVLRLELSRISKDNASRELKRSAPADGWHIPYFGRDSKRTGVFRIRFDDYPCFTEPTRYLAPNNSNVHAYFPPLVNWEALLEDVMKELFISEGELKAAACTSAGFPCIGIPGIPCWHGTKYGLVLLPELNDIPWMGRSVTIIPDSDIDTNFNVKREAYRLADALTDAGAMIVKVLHLPGRDDRKKVGVDDYLKDHTPKQLEALIANTLPCQRSREFRELDKQYIYVASPSMVVKDSPQGPVVYEPRVFKDEVEVSRKATITGADGNPRLVSAAKLWFESPSRPQVARLTYRPGQPRITTENELNLWRGLGCEPRKGDTQLWEKLLTHLFPVPAEREWAECWFAAPLQKPGLKLLVAMVLWGFRQGTGKTLLGTTVGLLHGEQNYAEITQTELGSQFNDWLVQKTFVQGSEVCGEKDTRAVADRLKTIITGVTIQVNKKFQPGYTLPNVANLYLTSNHQTAVFVGEHARRFAIFNTKNEPLPTSFYAEFVRWRDMGGLSAILYRLQQKNLNRFDPCAHAPRTKARAAMVEAGRTQVQSWCYELCANTNSALTKLGAVSTTSGALFTSKELLDIFERGEQTRLTEKGMALALHEEGFALANDGGQVRIPGTDWRLYLWVIRDVERIAKMSPGEIGKEYAARPDVKAKIAIAPRQQRYAAGREK